MYVLYAYVCERVCVVCVQLSKFSPANPISSPPIKPPMCDQLSIKGRSPIPRFRTVINTKPGAPRVHECILQHILLCVFMWYKNPFLYFNVPNAQRMTELRGTNSLNCI